MSRRTPAPRVDDAFTTTLGTLVGRLFGSSVVTEGTGTAADAAANEPEDVANFAMRVQLSLSAEHYVRTQSELKELVLLRNNLVHHFIDQHDLWSTDGFLTARDALVAAYERTTSISNRFEAGPSIWIRSGGCQRTSYNPMPATTS